MKHYAKFDANGFPLGFWNDVLFPDQEGGGRHPAIPADAVMITAGQWQVFMDNAGLRRWVDGHVVPHEPPGLTVDRLWVHLRAERDRLLSATDYTQVADWPGDAQPWRFYRQQLRDLPENTVDPAHPVWPQAPDFGTEPVSE